MNLPSGKTVERNLEVAKTDFAKKIAELMENEFNGYLVVTVEGYSGIEEGVLFIKKGGIVGASFEYPKFEVAVFGDAAAKQFFNALGSQHGVGDVCELSKQQLELIITFNEKTALVKEITQRDLKKLVQKEYTAEFAKKTLGKALERQESKYNIFKKVGLPEL